MSGEKYVRLDVRRATVSTAVMAAMGKLVMESILETKASTILDFFAGLRGTLSVTFEEGTWAAWLYDRMSRRRLMYSVGTNPPVKSQTSVAWIAFVEETKRSRSKKPSLASQEPRRRDGRTSKCGDAARIQASMVAEHGAAWRRKRKESKLNKRGGKNVTREAL